jgi:predicted NodU family carbamoyl transferase
MGLAPYGDKSLVKKFEKIIKINKNGSYQIKDKWFDFFQESFSDEFIKMLGFKKRDKNKLTKNHVNLAFAAQNKLENSMLGKFG